MSNTDSSSSSDDEKECMLDETITNNNNITEDDLETKKLDGQIEESVQLLEKLQHPEEINLNPPVDEDFIGKFFEQIKSLPRDKAVQLLTNLAKNNKLPEHNFNSVNEQKKAQNEKNLKDRIRELKLRRSSKTILTNYEQKLKQTLQQTNIENKSEDSTETVNDSVTLTKSQKKRRRRTANKKSKNQPTDEPQQIT